ncbi:MAG TPA: hypothetical protein VN193_07050 [Candidatus Angelobacter sp.]|nr:hypothetical protein [Candidatus Angelobacter sp.]
MLTTRDVVGVAAPIGLLPCPLARHGLGSPLMAQCPGFAAEPVSFTSIGAGESLGVRESCAHLGTQRGPRGFVSACRHPGGRPPEAEDLAGRGRSRRVASR